MDTLFLIASGNSSPLGENHIELLNTICGIHPVPRWIEQGRALAFSLPQCTAAMRRALEAQLAYDQIDLFLLNRKNSCPKKLLLCDMDSTIVDGETLDTLSVRMGVQDSVAAITAKAMDGQLDFCESLQARTALLKGMPYDAVTDEIAALAYNSGAKKLVQNMAESGAVCVLLSGGFTCFTKVVAKELGFHHHHGNTLEFVDGVATGAVIPPILDAREKRRFLEYYKEQYGVQRDEILAVGDGANDFPMLEGAGLGVGFRPKEYLLQRIEHALHYGGLESLLYLQQEENSR